jgi:hypothetical protein
MDPTVLAAMIFGAQKEAIRQAIMSGKKIDRQKFVDQIWTFFTAATRLYETAHTLSAQQG